MKTSIGIFQNCWAKIDFDTIVRRHMEPAFLGSKESFILEKMRQMYTVDMYWVNLRVFCCDIVTNVF